MKKIVKAISCLLLVGSLFVLASCNTSGYTAPAEYFELSAFTNNSDNDAYDSKYFYRNDLQLFGADASCIYVPEGRHTDGTGNDEYGGYYYMYPSATNADGYKGLIAEYYDGQYKRLSDENGNYVATSAVYRSKDLVDWELCGGVDGTFSIKYYDDSWIAGAAMAPDVIYDEVSGKYFIYSQTQSKTYDENPSLYTECIKQSQLDTWQKRFDETHDWERNWENLNLMCIGIYVSDTPTGPFVPVTSENYYGDANEPNLNGKILTNYTPSIDISSDNNLDIPWGTIDAHPFMDSDGQLYLYFCHHVDSNDQGVHIWGMKMKDFVTPDYSTMTLLIRGGYTTVTKNDNWEREPWNMASYDMGEKYVLENGAHGDGNEGAFMIAKNYINDKKESVRRYILCYSGGGYNNKYYDISQTVSDNNPLGPFTKPSQYASAICGTSFDNSWMPGCGHGCLVYSPTQDELFILGWGHANETYQAEKYGRWYSVDKAHWVTNPEYGLLLYGNGPTKSCQPKMYDSIGVKNIAKDAKITITSKNGYSGTQYLNDELFVSHSYYADWEFASKGETLITLNFSEPRTISSVLVYNSYNYDYAFSQIDYMEFNLAEKPSWYKGSEYVPVARVSDIEFSKDFIGTSYNYVEAGSSCLASFNEIKVNSITISVSKKISKSNNSEIRISDIVVLGK